MVLKGFEWGTVEAMVEFMYSEIVENMNDKMCESLLELGHAYEIQDLKDLCFEYLMSKMTPENAMEFLRLAKKYSSTKHNESLIELGLEMIPETKLIELLDILTFDQVSNIKSD